MAFRESLAERIGATLASLGTEYLAVHVRNTDMKTDYEPFFRRIKPGVDGHRLLVCSDDPDCKRFAQCFFDTSEVLFSSNIPDTGGRRLHGNPSLDPETQLEAAFSDLMALALSRPLFSTQTDRARLSGFSSLAQALQQNRALCDRLLTSARADDRVALGFSGRPGWDAPIPDLITPDLDLLPPSGF